MSRQRYPMSLDDQFQFGKHEGAFLWAIIESNPGYVDWCLENITGFELDNDAYIYLDRLGN